MELSKQVCSLELSKQLKTLGVKQESLFWWFAGQTQFVFHETEIMLEGGYKGAPYSEYELYSAFTIAELGEMLPDIVRSNKNLYLLKMRKLPTHYSLCYESVGVAAYLGPDGGGIEADTEADARAKMLIYLLENKLTVTK